MNNVRNNPIVKFTLLLLLTIVALLSACSKDDENSPDGSSTPIEQRTITKEIAVDTTIRNIETDANKCDCLIAKDLTIRTKVTLEPGVTVCFEANKGLAIEEEGALIAKGTADKKIVFTGKEKIKGYWKGILFFSSDVRNELDYVEISYGGGSPVDDIWYNIKANLALASSSIFSGKVKLTHSLVSNSAGYGVAVQEGGIIQSFSTNEFKDNTLNGIRLPANEVGKLDATSKFTGNNGDNSVEVYASTMQNPTESVWPAFADGSKYLIKRLGSNEEIVIRSGLKIQEGAILLFEPETALIIEKEGYLIAKGSSSKRITFTGKVQTEPSWRGILFFSGNILNELDFVDVSYGGSAPADYIWFNKKANVALAYSSIFSGKLKITNATISNSGGYGLAAQGNSTLTQSSNTFSANTQNNVAISL